MPTRRRLPVSPFLNKQFLEKRFSSLNKSTLYCYWLDTMIMPSKKEFNLMMEKIINIFKSKAGEMKRQSFDEHIADQSKIRTLFSNQYSIVQSVTSAFEGLINNIAGFSANSKRIHLSNKDFSSKFEEQKRLIFELEGINRAVHDISNEVNENSNLTAEIIQHLQMVDNIAKQTDILSLNATIEAARAGQSGKAFAVVAGEVRKLADSSQKSASDIRVILTKLDTSSKVITEKLSQFETQLAKHNTQLRFNTDHLLRESEQIKSIIEVMNSECEASSTWATTNHSRVITELEKMTKMTSDLIGSLTGNQINDLDPDRVVGNLNEFEIIDVRKDTEFNDELSHIDGANLITLGAALDEFLTGADKKSKYLFVCRSGGRSARAARLAQSYGVNNIFNLSGGMLEWNKRRLPTAFRPSK